MRSRCCVSDVLTNERALTHSWVQVYENPSPSTPFNTNWSCCAGDDGQYGLWFTGSIDCPCCQGPTKQIIILVMSVNEASSVLVRIRKLLALSPVLGLVSNFTNAPYPPDHLLKTYLCLVLEGFSQVSRHLA